jgi:anthranilate synthase/aminodeoxychorismate synthase-like glutamine amidotransferase
MLLVIDNYDSFTYNLVQYFGELGEEVRVERNDSAAVKDVAALPGKGYSGIVISPGPCTPSEAGVSLEVVKKLAGRLPILGVCLGHQTIGQAFGGKVVRAREPMHGKVSQIMHEEKGIFAGLPAPMEATRYHSLIVEAESLPSILEITAFTLDGEIMGLRHKAFDVHGVQFHPESIMTPEGKKLLANFLKTPGMRAARSPVGGSRGSAGGGVAPLKGA